MLRSFSLATYTPVADPPTHSIEHLALGFVDLIGDRRLKTAYVCEFDLAEEAIGLLEFDTGAYEVIIGECARPTIFVYSGTSGRDALSVFIRALSEHICEEDQHVE